MNKTENNQTQQQPNPYGDYEDNRANKYKVKSSK